MTFILAERSTGQLLTYLNFLYWMTFNLAELSTFNLSEVSTEGLLT